jgi:succinyl-CoA synthetase beta subunit
VPQAVLVEAGPEAREAVRAFGGEGVVKGQVLTGGRGKAGAIRLVSSEDEAESAAQEILKLSVKGLAVQRVLITEKLDIQAEYYAGVTVDREAKSVVLILSAAGGVDIEEIAANEPEKIRRFAIEDTSALDDKALTQWLSESFSGAGLLDQAVAVAQNMVRLFRELDCSLVEINPLAVVAGNRLVAADAKMVFDDNAVAGHPEIAQLRNPEEYTADELEAREAGLSFVSLSGQIGCMVNGAGLAMATMDGIKLAGGNPANFLDVGGSSNPQKVLDAMRILLRNQEVKVLLINIFGGITRCDDVAQGIVMAREKLDVSVPIVIRLVGTNEEEGRAILERAGMIVARSMTDAIRDAVKCAQGGSRP